MNNIHKHIIGYLFATPYSLASQFIKWYKKFTNTCMYGCEKCYNYNCQFKKK